MDNVEVDNGALADYTVSSDEGVGGHVQRVKLAYSADGSEVHVPADADGLLVNLGTNNDVAVTGTVDLGATDNAVLDAIVFDTFDRANASGDLGTSFSGDVWADDTGFDISGGYAVPNSTGLQVPNLVVA